MRPGIIFGVLVSLMVAGTAIADGIDDLVEGLRAQQQGDHGQAVALLTRAIESGDLAADEQVSARVKRGNSYYALGRIDRAVADYSAAIAARPDHVEARFNRGIIRFARGDISGAVADYGAAIAAEPDRVDLRNNRAVALLRLGRYADAIKDYDHALELAPEYLSALRGRARAHFYQGDFTAAAADYRRVLGLGPASLYSRLWFHIALKRSGQDGGQAFRELSPAYLEAWPGPIIRLFLGEVTPAQVVEGLETGGNVDTKNARARLERACEAYFFLGEDALIRGERERAVDYFRKAVATGITEFVEYTASKVELARLGQ